MRLFRYIVGDAKGALAIEFAFVAPLFLLLLLVIVELGLTLTTQSLLDGATRDAARLIRTGQVQSQTSPISTFQTLLCNDMKPLMSVSKCDSSVIFEVETFSSLVRSPLRRARATTTRPGPERNVVLRPAPPVTLSGLEPATTDLSSFHGSEHA